MNKLIGRIFLKLLKIMIKHHRHEFDKIIAGCYIDSREFAYGTTILRMQDRIAYHWGYLSEEEALEGK